MKFLIFACLLASAVAHDENINEDEEKACVKDYLKGENLTSMCKSLVADVEQGYVEMLTTNIESNSTLNCAKEKFIEYKILDFVLHADYLKKADEGNQEREVVRLALKDFCVRLEKINNEFENELVKFKSTAKRLMSKEGENAHQCMYKYFLDKKTPEMSDFIFDTSEFDSVNCTSYFEDLDNKFKVLSTPEVDSMSKFRECVSRKKAEVANYAFLMGVALFDFSEVQKEKFKTILVKAKTAEPRHVLECARDMYEMT